MISSLSFRMFMLVFPVCHVLNYEYADNNKKKTTTEQLECGVCSQGVMSLVSTKHLHHLSLECNLFVWLLGEIVMDGA